MQITTESIQEQIPYYLSQEAKENLVKALEKFPKDIDYYLNRYQTEYLQGDGWTSVEVVNFDSGERKHIKAMLLSNSCDVAPENPRTLPAKLTFSSIINLDRYQELLLNSGLNEKAVKDKIKAIKEQRVTSLFYLPKGAALEQDSIALLDDLHTVPLHRFHVVESKQKLFTFSMVGFYLFILKLSVHFCRLHENVDRSVA